MNLVPTAQIRFDSGCVLGRGFTICTAFRLSPAYVALDEYFEMASSKTNATLALLTCSSGIFSSVLAKKKNNNNNKLQHISSFKKKTKKFESQHEQIKTKNIC